MMNNTFYPNNNYTNNNFYVLQQIRQVIQCLGISNNIRVLLQRGYSIQQIQQQLPVQWVSRVMNTQQALQLQFRGYTWNQVQGLVIQEIQRQIININQEIINQRMNQQMMMNTTTMMGNLPSMMMRQPVTIQNKLNNTQIHGNLQLIRTTPNVANQVPLAQTSNKDINSVPKNPINDPIKGYLEEIKNYVQNKMPLLLNKDNLNDQSWSALVDIQGKLSTVLDSSDKSKSVGDYLKYSEWIDQFFEYWQKIMVKTAVSKSFLKYVEERLSKIENPELIDLTQTPKSLQAKDLLNINEVPLNNGKKTERPKLAKRYNAFVAIGNTYEKQDISGLRKYLTQLHSWIQEEYKWIENKDNKTSAEEMNLFCNVCEYYANVTKCFLNLVKRDYDDIFDLNDELFKLYQGKFKDIEKKNNDSPNIKGYVARKLHWLKMNFDQSSPAMLMVSKQFAYYKTDSDKHISELQKQLQIFQKIKEENPSDKFKIITTTDTDSTDNLEVNTPTDSNPYENTLSEVVKSVNTLNADIERISASNSVQRLTADRARGLAAKSLAKVRSMCEEKTKNDKFNRIMRLPKSVEIRSNFFTWCGWVWYRIRRLFNGEASLATNSLTNEAYKVIKDQLCSVLSDNNIKLLSLGFLSQYKINAVLIQNSQWLADNVINKYLVSAMRSHNVIRGCERKVLEAFYNIVPEANIQDNNSFNGVKYGLLSLVSNVLGVTVNQTIFEFLKETASKYIKREDSTLDYLSTSEIAVALEGAFTDDQEICKKLQSEIGKLFVDKFETNLKNEFSEVRRVIEQLRDLTTDNSGAYKCNDNTISNELFDLNRKYIKDNIDSVNTGATFSNIFKHDPDFNHRKDFLSKVKFNLQGYVADGQQCLNQLQESFLSNLSLEHESQCRRELDDIQTRKQARESVEQKQKQKQQNKNDANNINNDTAIIEEDDDYNIEENDKKISKVTLKKINIETFAEGNEMFYCSESPKITEENGENKGENQPNNSYPAYPGDDSNEFKVCKPGLVDDRYLNDDNNSNFGSAPAIAPLSEPISSGLGVNDTDEIFTNNSDEEEVVDNLKTSSMTLENNENKTYTNNPDSVPAAGTLQGGSDTTPGNNENENEGFMNKPVEVNNLMAPNMTSESKSYTNNPDDESSSKGF